MDRRCAGALVALAACIATTAAAPTASNQTALDLYDGASEGCYYNFQHYGEGDRIMTNEPCLNCTCHNRMLMCYLRVCPFTKPIGQDCSVEKRADQCCPIVTCPDVPVDLLTSTSTSSPAEYGETGLGKLDRYGCSINGKYFPEGSKVPPTPNKPCEHCYCIRNMTTCVMQECTLHVDGCTPIYRKDVCCPVRYSCDHPEDEIPLLDDMTTTVRPTPGFLLTTTTLSPVTQMSQDCVHDDKIFADGALIKTEKACEHCYCMKGDIVCVVQECGAPMENEGKNCTSMPPREGQCCPDTYICEGDELTTETKPDFTTVSTFDDVTTISPPRRVSIEGSGYRSETDEPFTEVPTFEPDTEGSGEEQEPFKPTDTTDSIIPESETSPPFIATDHDENIDQYNPSTPKVPATDKDIVEQVTTEPDKGENTVPSGAIDEDSSDVSVQGTTPETETTNTKLIAATESSTNALPEDASSVKDKIASHEETTATEPAPIAESAITDHELHTVSNSRVTTESEILETTVPTRRKEDDEEIPTETTTMKDAKEFTTKPSDLIAPVTRITESTTSTFIEPNSQTSTSSLPEKNNEVKEPTTDLNLEVTTKSDLIKTETQSATTVQPEIASELSTPSKVDLIETTSVNPIENEIDEESFPTSAPGRIPGEGDCLLDGVTYSHDSIVPSNNNCHTSCRCISSIVKCDPIICSPPPDYMDNCQPMYDSPESCCPTYVCDHPRETVPPQSHSQMAGTESPIPTPTIGCDGDQCEITKGKEDGKPAEPCTSKECADDSSKKTDDCGLQGCGEVENKPNEPHPIPTPTIGCDGDQCEITKGKEDAKPAEPCTSEECADDSSKKPDDCGLQGCGDVENKPKEPRPIPTPTIGCDGDQCEIVKGEEGAKPAEPCTSKECADDSSKKPDDCGLQGCGEEENKPKEPHSEPTEECVGDRCLPSPESCADGKCETAVAKDQTCNNENGCKIPVLQKCQGDDCSVQTDVSPTKTESTSCDNPDNCKVDQIPEKSPDCKGKSCISESQPQSVPFEKQDCKHGDDCAQSNQTPTVEECNEEECRQQQIPVVNKPVPTDCTDTECSLPANIPQTTETPEINTPIIAIVTDLPKASETKSEEPVTDLPKTTTIEKEIEPSTATEVPISDKEEELGTTSQYDTDIQKVKEPEMATKIPEVQQESVTDKTTETQTTMAPLDDITTLEEMLPEDMSVSSEIPTTEISDLPDKDTKEVSTDLPSHSSTPLSESGLDDKHSEQPITNAPEDVVKVDTIDISTVEPSQPAIHSTSSLMSEETTESQERLTLTPEGLERDGQVTTKEPEYVQDSAPRVTESTETYTTEPQSINTDKFEVTPIRGQEPQSAATTPKAYDSETNIPEILETKTEGAQDFSTIVPEQQTTSPQEEDNKVQKLPDEPITSQPVMKQTTADLASKDEAHTKASVFDDNEYTTIPEIAVGTGGVTQAPDFVTTLSEDSSTKAPIRDITSEPESHAETSEPHITTHQVTTQESDTPVTEDKNIETPVSVTVNIQTETPMSIVKDHDGDEINITKAPESEMTTDYLDLITKKLESPEVELPLPTSSEKPITDTEKVISISDEDHATATTEKSIADQEITISPVIENEVPTQQPAYDSEKTARPETETTTDNALVSITIVDDLSSKLPDPSVTETSIQEFSVPNEETSESAPFTSIPSEDIDTKSPGAVTESSMQSSSEGVDIITPTQEQTDKNTEVTELPELTIHEHPTEPSSIVKEPEQSVTEDLATKVPVQEVTEPQELVPEKDATDVLKPQDAVTNVPEIPPSVPQQEETVVPEHEIVTELPGLAKTTVSEVDETPSNVPEIPATESQKESTETPVAQITEIAAIDAQKEATEAPVITDNLTSAPKISEIVTEGVEAENEVTNVSDVSVTELHKDTTEAPESYDIVTIPSDILAKEHHKETTDVPEIFEMAPHKKITLTPDTQEITEISATESQKVVTETPGSQDTATKVSEISPKATEPSETQDSVTNVPKIPAAELEEETTKVPEPEQAVTNISEIPETAPNKDATEAPIMQDVATSIPEVIVTEYVPVENTGVPVLHDTANTVPEISITEPQKESTEAPAHGVTGNVPDIYVTEPQKELTEAPATTNTPVAFVTESHIYVTPATDSTETSATELSDTEPKKDTTQLSESQEAVSTSPEIDETVPEQKTTDTPVIPIITDVPETLSTELQKEPALSPEMQDVDSKSPETTDKETQKEVTNTPDVQIMTTNAPEVSPTESQKEVTETKETSEKTITEMPRDSTELPESQDTATDLPEVLATESQKEATEIPAIATTLPEVLATDSEKEITEAPVIEPTTKTPEMVLTEGTRDEAEPIDNTVTEKDELSTESPIKITVKFDDHTPPEQQELETPTQSSKIESDASLPTENEYLIEQSTKVPESLATESPDKVTDSGTTADKQTEGMAADDEKPQEEQEITTEISLEKPSKTSEFIKPEKSDITTETSISPKPIEPETKAPEISDTKLDTTRAPESSEAEKQDYPQEPESELTDSRQTEATSAPLEDTDIVTKAPVILEPHDKTPETSKEPEQTSESRDEYPETTPYLVLLEEHTHKKDIYTDSPDEEITVPSDKESEPSTPEAFIDKVTESVPSMESGNLPQEDAEKEQSAPEITDKITEPSLVSEDITTISPSFDSPSTEKPQYVDSNEISTSAPTRDEEPTEAEKPLTPTFEAETEKEIVLSTEKPHETTAPEEEFILATTRATTLKVEDEPTTPTQLDGTFGKPDEAPKPATIPEKVKPDTSEEIPKPGANEVQPTEEALQPDDESHFPPSGTSGYGQEPDYGEEDSFGPGTCRYGGKVYVSAQQIPRDDPCDFCFCFRSDIICLQQSCPPPIHGCHEEPIQGFCCPRYECPVSMATTLNVTTTTTTTTTTLPPHFLPHAYKGAAQRRGCQIKGHTYKVGEVVRASSGPCLHCTCGGDGQMKCDPKVCTPEPMLRQMIAAAVSAKRRR